jgi:hypothetical protein
MSRCACRHRQAGKHRCAPRLTLARRFYQFEHRSEEQTASGQRHDPRGFQANRRANASLRDVFVHGDGLTTRPAARDIVSPVIRCFSPARVQRE